ncbi:hypothetical protein [Stenotrophomonas muris]|uniref:HEAT repeat domain-containing protein n=1 Tax=Stenotrophomonas muris TaxID=2963283 RepID=A0ABU5MKK7_9GAMM|nr:hypothetical protein [Stenotrophomonas muris]MBH1489694.1 hypothetical protein [Stenotrophomonas maltophilia]MBH1549275.1 hypothetical protein [Stenotrophomonas maltophilia]MBH1573094.1 hypothetical protein [Stenotrophomonas maltophilia]MBH1673701.1 hypothetical protein [Stenotrophomonas maltophilia]MBH1828561.1 hypothetical protein [Stenotrophomonas maltophilia]
METKDDVVGSLHEIYRNSGAGTSRQLAAVRALGRAGGPKAAQLLWQIYEETSAGSVTQMACIAALGESARGF